MYDAAYQAKDPSPPTVIVGPTVQHWVLPGFVTCSLSLRLTPTKNTVTINIMGTWCKNTTAMRACWLWYLFLELEVEVPTVLLQLCFPLGSLLAGQLESQLPICLQGTDAVLLLIQQVLHLLLVHLHTSQPQSAKRGGGREGGMDRWRCSC